MSMKSDIDMSGPFRARVKHVYEEIECLGIDGQWGSLGIGDTIGIPDGGTGSNFTNLLRVKSIQVDRRDADRVTIKIYKSGLMDGKKYAEVLFRGENEVTIIDSRRLSVKVTPTDNLNKFNHELVELADQSKKTWRYRILLVAPRQQDRDWIEAYICGSTRTGKNSSRKNAYARDYQFIGISTAEDAIAAFSDNGPFDLVIMSNALTGSETKAAELANQLLETNANQLIIILAEDDSHTKPEEKGFKVFPHLRTPIRQFMIDNNIMSKQAPLY